jgi:hypothetical protein
MTLKVLSDGTVDVVELTDNFRDIPGADAFGFDS